MAYPAIPGDIQLCDKFYMRKRNRRMVPAPSHTRLPSKEPTQEGKARLYSLYLRPWVLDPACATEEVPHIGSLDLLPNRRRLRTKLTRDSYFGSYERAWSWYVRGNVVTEHARQIIVQFMAACIGSSGKHDERPEECAEETNTTALPSVDLALTQVRQILDRMSQDNTRLTSSQ